MRFQVERTKKQGKLRARERERVKEAKHETSRLSVNERYETNEGEMIEITGNSEVVEAALVESGETTEGADGVVVTDCDEASTTHLVASCCNECDKDGDDGGCGSDGDGDAVTGWEDPQCSFAEDDADDVMAVAEATGRWHEQRQSGDGERTLDERFERRPLAFNQFSTILKG